MEANQKISKLTSAWKNVRIMNRSNTSTFMVIIKLQLIFMNLFERLKYKNASFF